MTKKVVHYIGFYKPENISSEHNRFAFLSAVRKMDYICKALNSAGFKVNIISPSWVNATSGYFKSKNINLDDNISVTMCPSFGAQFRILRGIRRYFSFLWLILWVLLNVKRNDTVIVYHSLLLVKPIRLLKKLKKVKIILEVEELYCDVSEMPEKTKKLEMSMIDLANSFLFSTDLLPERIDLKGRKYVVCYGEYIPIKNNYHKENNGKINLVYAGIIDRDKLGAFNAIESAAFLDDSYILHIIGFGEENDIKLLEESINEINKRSLCKVFFHGQKNGNEFIEFMQKCDIGLSTQKIEGKYLESSFPSKVLSYICLGLKVVSCEIECVKRSKVNKLVTYYSENRPELIANAIKLVDTNSNANSYDLLSSLHKNLSNELLYLIK